METKQKKSGLLLAAGIMGLCGLVLWFVVFFVLDRSVDGRSIVSDHIYGLSLDEQTFAKRSFFLYDYLRHLLEPNKSLEQLLENDDALAALLDGDKPLFKVVEDLELDTLQDETKRVIMEAGRKYKTRVVLELAFIFVALISLAFSIVLNFWSWRTASRKKALVAGILYLLSFTIPSAVLCFIGFGKLKKQREQV
jgi:hypothetical protein